MLERDIEAYLVKRCKEIGALCDKFTSPQRRSVPDRLITFGGRVLFVELKATGKKPTEAQVRDHDRRWEVRAEVMWTDSVEGVDVIIRGLLGNSVIHTNPSFKVLVYGN
ncbi:hypothetical protein D3C80_1701810 [compost metagenome]